VVERISFHSKLSTGPYVDSTYTPAYRQHCTELTRDGVPCTELRLEGSGHGLWLQQPGTAPPWADGPQSVTSCTAPTPPVDNCSPLAQVLTLADDATR